MGLADVVAVYTDKEVGMVRDAGGVRNPVIAVNNTIDTVPVDQAIAAWKPDDLAAFRNAHGLSGKSLLLFCGRLRAKPSTDLAVLLRAVAALPRGVNEPVLAVIGSGEQEPELRALAAELGIAERVKWLGAIYAEEQLAPWFLTAKLFVYPGAIGLSILQSFAYGLPVVTHADILSHGPEIAALVDGYNGKLFARGDILSLSRTVEMLLQDVSLRRELATNARRTIETSFSLRSMVARFREAIVLTSTIATGGR
jgi:glycosyltransferase involved in cell wall biosynthesis